MLSPQDFCSSYKPHEGIHLFRNSIPKKMGGDLNGLPLRAVGDVRAFVPVHLAGASCPPVLSATLLETSKHKRVFIILAADNVSLLYILYVDRGVTASDVLEYSNKYGCFFSYTNLYGWIENNDERDYALSVDASCEIDAYEQESLDCNLTITRKDCKELVNQLFPDPKVVVKWAGKDRLTVDSKQRLYNSIPPESHHIIQPSAGTTIYQHNGVFGKAKKYEVGFLHHDSNELPLFLVLHELAHIMDVEQCGTLAHGSSFLGYYRTLLNKYLPPRKSIFAPKSPLAHRESKAH